VAQLARDERLADVRQEVAVVGSKNALRPSLKSDMCVCIPEPFSPNSGLGMNVACQPYLSAYSLTVMR